MVFNWKPDNVSKYAAGNNQLNIVFLYSRDALEVVDTVTERKTGKAIVPYSGIQNEIVKGYVFWSSADNRNLSPSVYWRCK